MKEIDPRAHVMEYIISYIVFYSPGKNSSSSKFLAKSICFDLLKRIDYLSEIGS